MNSYISTELRQQIARRAKFLCEYCLIHKEDTLWGCEVDHIVSVKHGGETHADNLAYACAFCNRHKGSDLGSLIPQTDTFSRFFNPRMDQWATHFELDYIIIRPLTDIGEVTVRILQFNTADRLMERQILSNEKRYPPTAAYQFIDPKKE